MFCLCTGELPNLSIPFHTVFKLTPIAYGKYVAGHLVPRLSSQFLAVHKSKTTAFHLLLLWAVLFVRVHMNSLAFSSAAFNYLTWFEG